MDYRIEHDTMGEVRVPANRCWGAQTQRSHENFPIGTEKIPQEIIHAFAVLKKAAALANCKLGNLDARRANAIAAACDEILAGKYKEDERIPSVREYAVLLEVNANTAVKAYDLLATDEIIYNKRGLGYFVSVGAKKLIKKTRKKEFMKERLPELARQMQLLDISIDEVKEELEKNLNNIKLS